MSEPKNPFRQPGWDTPAGSVPTGTPADLRLGHGDSCDTGTEELSREDQLLAGIRDGSWLDAQQFEPLRYAIPDLIPEGMTLLVGPPKVGKSWLLTGLLLGVASGGRALGKIRTGPSRRVLYLALEDGDRRMQSRCRSLLDGQPIPARYHYATQVARGDVFATILAFLARHPDTVMVVIDTLGKVLPPERAGESSFQRDYRIGGALKSLADQHPGLSVVVIHHTRKAFSADFIDQVSGTQGLGGAADTIIVLSRERKSNEGVLSITGRDVPENAYALRMVDGIHWELDGDDLAEAARRVEEQDDSQSLSDTSAEIVQFVRAAGPDGVTTREVTDKFGPNARRYLTRRVDEGRLEKVGRGRYRCPSVTTVPVSQSQVSGGAGWDSVGDGVPTGVLGPDDDGSLWPADIAELDDMEPREDW